MKTLFQGQEYNVCIFIRCVRSKGKQKFTLEDKGSAFDEKEYFLEEYKGAENLKINKKKGSFCNFSTGSFLQRITIFGFVDNFF